MSTEVLDHGLVGPGSETDGSPAPACCGGWRATALRRWRLPARGHRAGGAVCAVDRALRSLLHRPHQGDAGAERAHWFGTDNTGRDILSRILYGTRNTLVLGLVGVIVGGAIGGVLGIFAAYYRRLGSWIMRLVDIMLAFPAILIGLAMAAIFGAGLSAVIIALVFATIPDVARVARGAAVGVMGQEFMEAGRAVGVSDAALIWRYLTLNCISTIFVFLTLRFGQIILIGSVLGFLGMGAQPPTAELGMMAAQGRDFLFMAPHIATIPSCAIFVIVLAANLLGDAFRDVLDPRLQT